jgi:hypothetical protein
MKFAAPIVAALALAACNAGGMSNLPGMSGQIPSESGAIPQWKATGEATQVCPDVPAGFAQCDLLLERSRISPDVLGLAPADFQAAYKLPSATKGAGQIVAIVDAYDNPQAETDVKTYRAEFKLGKGKFVKYNEKGETKNYPPKCSGSQTGWCLEDDLDIEMVAAVCPKCTTYLIEANAADTGSLEKAELEAVKLGAHIVSNSWGCKGSNACLNPAVFSKTGVTYLASSGDFGYGTQAPAALASVISVGGTFLTKSGAAYSEKVWPDSGAGCAIGVTKPSWQHDPKCKYRTMNDVSAVAAGVAEYDTFGGPYHGWLTVQGTSIGSPLLASVYALAGNADTINGAEHFWSQTKKERKHSLHDITSGSDTGCPSKLAKTYLCEAGTKQYGMYSGPDGWGTPNGIKAF